jgi:hypothetical protein
MKIGPPCPPLPRSRPHASASIFRDQLLQAPTEGGICGPVKEDAISVKPGVFAMDKEPMVYGNKTAESQSAQRTSGRRRLLYNKINIVISDYENLAKVSTATFLMYLGILYLILITKIVGAEAGRSRILVRRGSRMAFCRPLSPYKLSQRRPLN